MTSAPKLPASRATWRVNHSVEEGEGASSPSPAPAASPPLTVMVPRAADEDDEEEEEPLADAAVDRALASEEAVGVGMVRVALAVRDR